MGQLSSGAFDGQGAGVFQGGGGASSKQTFIYDFAQHGGAVGTIALGGLGSGATILGGYMVVNTPLTGGAAMVSIAAEAPGDVVAAAAISGAPWSTTGKKAILPKANTPESTSITTTQARNVSLVITGGTLSAGKVTLYLDVQPGS